MTYTDKTTVAAQYIIDKLQNSDLFKSENVWYGDTDHIPEVPAATVTGGVKARTLAGATFRTDVGLNVEIMVYAAHADEDHANQLAADQLIEQVEELLHQDPYLGGLVVHGYVHSVEPGYALRNDEIMRAALLTWQGLVKTRIGG